MKEPLPSQYPLCFIQGISFGPTLIVFSKYYSVPFLINHIVNVLKLVTVIKSESVIHAPRPARCNQ